jgi:hypothetical protein
MDNCNGDKGSKQEVTDKKIKEHKRNITKTCLFKTPVKSYSNYA